MTSYAPRRSHGLERMVAVLAVTLALVMNIPVGTALAGPTTPTATVFGVVTGADHEALAGVTVSVYPWDGSVGAWAENSVDARTTGDDGAFTIVGLAPGRYTLEYGRPYLSPYVTTWWGGRLSGGGSDGFDLRADDSPADRSIEMVLGGAISGTVSTLGGSPLADAKVEVERDAEGPVTVKTDEQGNYDVVGLAPGYYTVHMSGPWGSPWIDTWWQDAETQDGATRLALSSGTKITHIDARLAAPSTISGRLVDPDGRALSGISIEAWHRRAGTDTWDIASNRRTDASGVFTIYNLREGEYRLAIAPAWSGDPEYSYQWWKGTPGQASAEVVEVPVQTGVNVGDITALRTIRVRMVGLVGGESPLVGESLHAVVLVDAGVSPQRSVQWFRDGAPIDGATDADYVVQTADAGARLSCTVVLTGANLIPKNVKLGPTGVVHAGRFTATAASELEGVLDGAGSVLSVADGSWDPTPDEIAYQWRRDGNDIAGENSPSYTTSSADLGHRLSVAVTPVRQGFEPLDEVLQAGTACYPQAAAPQPTVQGVRAAGSTLSIAIGPIPAGMTVSYQWFADGAALPGETSPSLMLPASTVGKRVTATATAQLADCPDLTGSEADSVPKTALAATPAISGTATVGKTLKVKRGTWGSSTTFSYRWYADGKAISGATKSYLTLAKAVRGKRITIKVTGRRSGYETVTMTSPSTRKVH